jgi:hypothetical protein
MTPYAIKRFLETLDPESDDSSGLAVEALYFATLAGFPVVGVGRFNDASLAGA